MAALKDVKLYIRGNATDIKGIVDSFLSFTSNKFAPLVQLAITEQCLSLFDTLYNWHHQRFCTVEVAQLMVQYAEEATSNIVMMDWFRRIDGQRFTVSNYSSSVLYAMCLTSHRVELIRSFFKHCTMFMKCVLAVCCADNEDFIEIMPDLYDKEVLCSDIFPSVFFGHFACYQETKLHLVAKLWKQAGYPVLPPTITQRVLRLTFDSIWIRALDSVDVDVCHLATIFVVNMLYHSPSETLYNNVFKTLGRMSLLLNIYPNLLCSSDCGLIHIGVDLAKMFSRYLEAHALFGKSILEQTADIKRAYTLLVAIVSNPAVRKHSRTRSAFKIIEDKNPFFRTWFSVCH